MMTSTVQTHNGVAEPKTRSAPIHSSTRLEFVRPHDLTNCHNQVVVCFYFVVPQVQRRQRHVLLRASCMDSHSVEPSSLLDKSIAASWE